jgi:uncharacterized protein with HEPN domain
MIAAIERIEKFTAGQDLAKFTDDEKTFNAVEYNLVIIGEAARAVPDEVAERHPAIPWNQIRGARNVVVHQYFEASISIIWETVERDLPALKAALQELLQEEPN